MEGFFKNPSVPFIFYEITAGGVTEGGGEVLRYIGDASLAIFPFERTLSKKRPARRRWTSP